MIGYEDDDWGGVESEPSDVLSIELEGYEGPLDVLLDLARSQKVDLTQIAILPLVEQYLGFVERARTLRLDLAADYLVMAAWLAYLKSRLLLPVEQEEEPSGEELAAALQFRLRRLSAMRDAVARLMTRNRLGEDVFARGAPEPVVVEREVMTVATLHDLLTAYAARRQANAISTVRITRREVWTLDQAREALRRLMGRISDWAPLDMFLGDYALQPVERRGALATTFAASLELARERTIELRQSGPFEPIYVRASSPDGA